ncbi:hypothetical protein [Gemmatimonas sp.]|uniref:hypothetical protein n=1 Tax=Gemmatimonas sp. TaxID=1962908 RepID=UPI003564F7B2
MATDHLINSHIDRWAQTWAGTPIATEHHRWYATGDVTKIQALTAAIIYLYPPELTKAGRRRNRTRSDQEIDLMVRLRLAGISIPDICQICDVSRGGFSDMYAKAMATTHKEMGAKLEVILTESIERHQAAYAHSIDHIAQAETQKQLLLDIDELADVERLDRTITRYDTSARTALEQIAKLTGINAVSKVELSGEVITGVRWIDEVATP